MPNTMDTEGTVIEPNAMEADRSQDDATEANAIYADAFNGVADDEDTLEDGLFDGEALETTSQGKNPPSLRTLHGNLLTTT